MKIHQQARRENLTDCLFTASRTLNVLWIAADFAFNGFELCSVWSYKNSKEFKAAVYYKTSTLSDIENRQSFTFSCLAFNWIVWNFATIKNSKPERRIDAAAKSCPTSHYTIRTIYVESFSLHVAATTLYIFLLPSPTPGMVCRKGGSVSALFMSATFFHPRSLARSLAFMFSQGISSWT